MEDAPLSLGLPDSLLPAPIAMQYTAIVEILPVAPAFLKSMEQ